jgi:hypothetical protein
VQIIIPLQKNGYQNMAWDYDFYLLPTPVPMFATAAKATDFKGCELFY